MTQTLIVIPARYGSTRFPGKPLAMIAGRSMIARVADCARAAVNSIADAAFVVATDDERISQHCIEQDIPAIITPANIASGSDRALAAADAFAPDAEFIINLQGDAPFTPADHLIAVAATLKGGAEIATPCIQLSWDALDAFRRSKETTPHSGTSCVIGPDGRALWFSKSILPALRNEADLRHSESRSPVCRHVGLYGFSRAALEKFTMLPPSQYETLEGLEQLRMLEHGMPINVVMVDPPEISTSGVDTPEDLERLEALVAKHQGASRA